MYKDPIKRIDYQKTRRDKLRSEGICYTCGVDRAEEGKVQCNSCLAKKRIKDKTYNDKGICCRCKTNAKLPNLTVCKKCQDHKKQIDKNLKTEIISHYGNECKFCGETHLDFLCIDHINNNGNEHRKQFISKKLGRHIYQWIKENNYPSGFQVLCHSCNHKKDLQLRYKLEVKHPKRRERRLQIKYDVILAYGGSCICCGERDIDKLTIDHIYGIKNKIYHGLPNYGDKLYSWIKKENFPKIFRILCMNCNFSFGSCGYCAHQERGNG